VSAEFPGIIRAARLSRPCRVCSRHRLNFEIRHCFTEKLEGDGGVKRLRRLAVLAAFYGTVALASWVAAGLAGLGSLDIEGSGAPIKVVGRAKSATARAEHVDAPRAKAPGERDVSVADIASGSAALYDPPPMPWPAAVPVAIASLSAPDPERKEAKEAAGSVKVADTGSDSAALTDPPPMPQPKPPVLFAAASPTDSVQNAPGRP
jgi:hypothetical protein